MSLPDALDAELDRAARGGTVQASDGDNDAEIDVVEADRLGVRIRRITVARATPYDPAEIARDWPREIRELPERLRAVEVDPGLGGATFRSDPDDRRDDSFVEIEVRGGTAEIRRHRVGADGREALDWTMTRDQLRRLVDTLARGPSPEA
jgi:hypothetical protein